VTTFNKSTFILRGFVILLFLIVALSRALAQDDPGSIRATLFEVDHYTASRTYRQGTNQYVWTWWYDGLGGLSYDNRRCLIEHSTTAPFSSGRLDRVIGSFINQNGGPTLAFQEYIPDAWNHYTYIGLQAWETSNSDPCVVHLNNNFWCNNNVNFRGAVNKGFRYIDYPPGVVNYIDFNEFCSDFTLECRFTYSVPTPNFPTIYTGEICDSSPRTLYTETYLGPYYADSRFRFETIWEYTTDPTNPFSWLFFGAAPVYYNFTSATPLSQIDFPFRNLVSITQETKIYYRVKTRMTVLVDIPNVGGAGQFFESTYSQVQSPMSVLPLPPTINSAIPSASCIGSNTGSINVNVTGVGQGEYLYILKDGAGQSSPCNPDLNDCGSSFSRVQHIDLNGNQFVIPDVAAGSHTFIVANKGGTTGVCWNYVNVDVAAIPALQLQPPAITPVSCQSLSDGAVTLSSTGGEAPFSYSLVKSAFDGSNKTGVFPALGAGTYTATIADHCGQSSIPVNVTEPLNILADVNSLSLTCQSPSDGSVQVAITQGEGTYSFGLLKDNQSVSKLDNATVSSWSVNNLIAGDYTLEIKDAARLQCAGFTQSVTLADPVLLQIDPNSLVKQDVTCFEKNDGLVQLNLNPSTQYNYILTNNNNTANQVKSTSPLFSGLSAASYTLTKQRNLSGCSDSYDYPIAINVTQPDEIVVALDAQNVSCFGKGDGQIEASVQGSIGPDTYTWETNVNGNWSTLSNSTTTLPALSGGTFRFTITGSNGCSNQTQVDVIEPALLAFSDVTIKDIKCLGDQGTIALTVTGGVTPYSYTYSTPDNIIQSSVPEANVNEGVYSLRVVDNNGCQTDYENTIAITQPSRALQSTYTLSDFNGYNTSCTGANDAYAQLTAAGGNESSYSNYTYALDGNFQSNSRIENIPPGVHTLSIQDGRGCIVMNTITITEPANSITTTLLVKSNVKCDGDNNGQISISASGGLNTYSFSLSDNIQEGTDSNFTNLAPGTYTISVEDKNGCTAEYTDEILLLTPSIHIVSHATNVLCKGGNDGGIQIEADGGDQPLALYWGKDLGTSPSLQGLTAGDYVLIVTDRQGCVAHQTTTITEPDLLTVEKSIPIPVCVGKATGEIRVSVKGGTRPFQYSVDQGSTYLNNAVIAGLPAGSYTITVKDIHGCLATSVAEITVRNDLPEPDFIVATSQNALDTLVINEISNPKPDSVAWTFDPGITVIDADAWSPEITISEPGNYAIAMKGFFGGCEYAKSDILQIKPYDPSGKKSADNTSDAIKQVGISPNPNKGDFNISVDLNQKQMVSIRVTDILGINHFSKDWEKVLHVEENITIPNAVPGIYVVQVITETDSYVASIVVNP